MRQFWKPQSKEYSHKSTTSVISTVTFEIPITTMRVVLIFAALGLVSQCDGLICMCLQGSTDAERNCPDVSGCRAGTVMDPCDCCRVCAKGLHETCGGNNDELGKCGQNMYCKTRPTVEEELDALGVTSTLSTANIGNETATATTMENDNTTLYTMSFGNETEATKSTIVEGLVGLDQSSTTVSETETSSAASSGNDATSMKPATNEELGALGLSSTVSDIEVSSTTIFGQETTTKSAELDSSSTASVNKIIRKEIFGNETGICVAGEAPPAPKESNRNSLLAHGISSGIGAGIGAGIGSAIGSSIGNRNRNKNNHPSQHYPSQQYPSQQFPSQQYPSQQFPSQQFPSQQYPSQQFPSQQYPSQQFPSQQFPSQQYPHHSSGVAPVGVAAGPTLTRTVETHTSGVGTPTHTKVVETYTGFGVPTNNQGSLGTGSSNIGTGSSGLGSSNQGNLGSGHYGSATTRRSVHQPVTGSPGFGSAYYGSATTRRSVHQAATRAPGFGSAYYGSATTRRSAARPSSGSSNNNYALSYGNSGHATQRPSSSSNSRTRPSSSSGKRKNNG